MYTKFKFIDNPEHLNIKTIYKLRVKKKNYSYEIVAIEFSLMKPF